MPVGRRRDGGDRGASTVELVLLTPLLVALVFAAVQGALLWHAHHALLAAAQHGDRLARDAGLASPARVAADTRGYLTQVVGGLVHDPRVQVTRERDTARVTVTGVTVGVLPGLRLRLQVSAVGPVERFHSPTSVGSRP